MTVRLQRTILREDVRQWVLDAICRGSLAPGAPLGEVELSQQIGISRTPLREALVALERDGFVVSRPGRGFAVAPLVRSEMDELYPLLGNLEAFALRASPCPSRRELDQLQKLNSKLGSSGSLARSLALDEEWHRRLLAGCKNQKVLALLERLKEQYRRLEYAFTRIVDNVEASRREHAEVLDLLGAGELGRAAALLESHWLDEVGDVVASRSSTRGK